MSSKFITNITHFINQQNFQFITDVSSYTSKEKDHEIVVACDKEHHFKTRLQTLSVYKCKKQKPVCDVCKSDNYTQDKKDKSCYSILDEINIQCRKCNQKYDINNYNNKCFCQLKIKKHEFDFYKKIKELLPDYRITREYVIREDEHTRVDLFIEKDGKKIAIELDDKQHYFQSSSRYLKDIKTSKYVVNNNMKLVRVEDTIAVEKVKEIVEFIEESDKTHLLLASKDHYYNHIII